MGFKTESETIGAISAALAKAQATIGNAAKDSINPHFKSKFAPYVNVREACQAQLSESGLAVSGGTFYEDGQWMYFGRLSHKDSGEYFKTAIPLFMGRNDMQSFAAAQTYAERQALKALVGIATEDDDGEGTMNRSSPPVHVTTLVPGQMSEAQYKFLSNLLSSCDAKEIMDICKKHKVSEPKMLTAAQASEEINRIQEMRKKNG